MKQRTDYQAAVIVVNWNGKSFIEDTLYALKAQSFTSFKTILVDNGSTDGSLDFINKQFPDVETIALSWNSGFAYANNVAIRAVKEPFTLLLNNDAVPVRDWVENLVGALEGNPQAGFASSKMLYFDNPGLIDRVGDAYTNAGVGKLRGRKEPASCYSEPEWIFGACAGAAIYRTKALKEVGLFDEDFFLINEDVDLSFRLQSRGHRCLYVPEALVFHKASSSIVHDSATSIYYGHRNLEWVYLKNMPLSIMIKTLPMHLLYVSLAFLFFFYKGHGRTYIRAKKHALEAMPKMLKKRRTIQLKRCVETSYLASLMEPEHFIDRKIIRNN